MGKQRSARVSTPCIAVLAIAVFAATALLYWPAGDNAFITIDDEDYVVDNPQVLGGLSADGLAWAFTTHHASNWHPLTWLSLQLDATVFGPEARSFHRTNVLLHATSAGLLLAALYGLTGAVWRSALVAALFAVHPLHVESVAWVAERKDVLSGTFFMAALLAYARFARGPSLLGYLAVLLAAVCGLLSKPMLVTLPCVLLLLDYWPLGRFSTAGPTKRGRPAWVGLIVEKIPFFAVAAAAAALTVDAQLDVAIHDLMDYPFQERLANALVSYANYLGQTCWPVNLAVYYPHPCGTITAVQLGGAVLLLGALSGLALWQFRAQPYLAVGWAWFLGMLVPVIGLVQVGVQARADRYTYLPHVGLFVAVAWCAERLVARSRWRIAVCTVAAAAAVAVCATLTQRQIATWRDDRHLFSQALAAVPGNWYASRRLAGAARAEGQTATAIGLLEEAARSRPDSDLLALNALGQDLAACGACRSGIQTLTRALQTRPEVGVTYANRGRIWAMLGDWSAAVADYRQAIWRTPENADDHYGLAHALSKSGDKEQANQEYRIALRLDPDWPRRAARTAWSAATARDPEERNGAWAVLTAEQASQAVGGKQPVLLDVLAAALAEVGQFDRAVAVAQQATQIAATHGQAKLAAAIAERCALYRGRRAFRHP